VFILSCVVTVGGFLIGFGDPSRLGRCAVVFLE
jgi:hypothetical protein